MRAGDRRPRALGGEAVDEEQGPDNDHRGAREPGDGARGGRAGEQDFPREGPEAEVEGRAGKHEDQAEETELAGSGQLQRGLVN